MDMEPLSPNGPNGAAVQVGGQRRLAIEVLVRLEADTPPTLPGVEGDLGAHLCHRGSEDGGREGKGNDVDSKLHDTG